MKPCCALYQTLVTVVVEQRLTLLKETPTKRKRQSVHANEKAMLVNTANEKEHVSSSRKALSNIVHTAHSNKRVSVGFVTCNARTRTT